MFPSLLSPLHLTTGHHTNLPFTHPITSVIYLSLSLPFLSLPTYPFSPSLPLPTYLTFFPSLPLSLYLIFHLYPLSSPIPLTHYHHPSPLPITTHSPHYPSLPFLPFRVMGSWRSWAAWMVTLLHLWGAILLLPQYPKPRPPSHSRPRPITQRHLTPPTAPLTYLRPKGSLRPPFPTSYTTPTPKDQHYSILVSRYRGVFLSVFSICVFYLLLIVFSTCIYLCFLICVYLVVL